MKTKEDAPWGLVPYLFDFVRGKLDSFSFRERFSGVQKNYPCRVEMTALQETL